VVVLITDGANDGPASVTRDTLLAAVRKEYDPVRPVHLITVGDRDESGVSRAGGPADVMQGRFHASTDPADICRCSPAPCPGPDCCRSPSLPPDRGERMSEWRHTGPA